MSATSPALPPFKTLAAALRKTTEHLAREVASPSESPPDWNDLEWAIARSASAMQGISTLLANRLRWRGPPIWQAFLVDQREQSVLRDALIGRLLERIDSATRDARIACVALKGSALRPLGLYSPGERPMGDVDLLVREADSTAIAAGMRSLDYEQAAVAERHTIYAPRGGSKEHDLGEHVDNPLSIEVHTKIAEALPISRVDITARLRPADARLGINAYPSLAALFLHLLLHAAGNMKAHALRQIQLHDIALLSRRLEDADRDGLVAATGRADDLWWAFPPLALSCRYYSCDLPPGLLARLRRCCPRMLRRSTDRNELTDVSWSNLRISAFPGIAWSRTPRDALLYVRSRALPGRTAVAGLRGMVKRHPPLGRIPWYQLSHGSRIARWVFSRPPRVQTILSVTAALRDTRV